MQKEIRRTRHTELALSLASRDERLMDLLRQRPHLLNPYPSIVTRLARRSRRFRQKLAIDGAVIEAPLLARLRGIGLPSAG